MHLSEIFFYVSFFAQLTLLNYFILILLSSCFHLSNNFTLRLLLYLKRKNLISFSFKIFFYKNDERIKELNRDNIKIYFVE